MVAATGVAVTRGPAWGVVRLLFAVGNVEGPKLWAERLVAGAAFEPVSLKGVGLKLDFCGVAIVVFGLVGGPKDWPENDPPF